jgi:transposase InsO family protein
VHSAAGRASQPRLVPRLRGGRLYDFLEERTHEGRKLRLLNIIDEFTHECLAIRVSRRLKSIDVIDVLSYLFILRGIPEHIRSDNGPEFLAKAVQEWIAAVGAKTAYITPGSPWENGFIESFMYGRPPRCKVSCEDLAAPRSGAFMYAAFSCGPSS